MKPIKFKEQNLTLFGTNLEGVKPLYAYSDGEIVMSKWKMNFKDRIKALLFGTIWLQVKTEKTHPPVTVFCAKNGFETSHIIDEIK